MSSVREDTGFGMVTQVKCPVCLELKTPDSLRCLSNSYYGQDDTILGHALITKCCGAVVFKDQGFDFCRGLYWDSTSQKRINGIVITDKPEVARKKRKVRHSKPKNSKPKTEYIEIE